MVCNQTFPEDSYNQNQIFPFYPDPINSSPFYDDERQGHLTLNLWIQKLNVSTPTTFWSPSVTYPAPLSIDSAVSLKISNDNHNPPGNILNLSDLSFNPSMQDFYMIAKSYSNLILGHNAEIIINTKNHLVLECNSNFICSDNQTYPSKISVYGGGHYCDLGAIHSGFLRIYYNGGYRQPFPINECNICLPTYPHSVFYGDSTTFILDSSAVLQIPDSIQMIFNGNLCNLNMNSGTSIQFGKNSSLILQNGAHIYADGCTFTNLDSNNNTWAGIIINNSIGDTITNCTFNNAIVSLSISDTGMAAGNKELIRGNTFNASTDNSTPNYGIYASNL